MTEPSDPPDPITPVEPAASPAGTEPPTAAARTVPAMGSATQAVVGAGVAVAALALLGGFVGAWSLDWTGFLLIVAGLAAAGAAYLAASGTTLPAMPLGLRDIALAGAIYALVMGILFTAEKLFDLDDLDDYGGIVGVLVTVLLTAAAAALYLAVTGRWFGTLAGPWTSAAGGGRPTLLVTIGTGLVFLGWLANVTIGVWLASTAAVVVALVVLGFVLARGWVDADDGAGGSGGQVAALVTLVVLGMAAILSVSHLTAIIAEDLGFDQVLPQLVVFIGVAIALGGAVLWTLPLVAPKGRPD